MAEPEQAAIKKAIQELSDLIEELNDGPWGMTADPQLGIQNVIDFTLQPALRDIQSRER